MILFFIGWLITIAIEYFSLILLLQTAREMGGNKSLPTIWAMGIVIVMGIAAMTIPLAYLGRGLFFAADRACIYINLGYILVTIVIVIRISVFNRINKK